MVKYNEKLTTNQILVKLGRYPFYEKINSLQILSRKLLDDELDILKPTYKPWELDSFLYLILHSKEKYTPYHIPSKQWNKDFSKIMQNIRFNTDNVINDKSDLDAILTTINLQQIDDQKRRLFFEMYRADYIFNCTEIKNTFEKLFKTSYEEISDLCFILFQMFKYEIPKIAFLSVFKKYKKSVEVLTIERDYFVEQDKLINKTQDKYNFCFKLFRAFPFIKHHNICYIPLPHNFKYACSDSLFSRFTTFYDSKKEDDNLRQQLAICFEKYLYHILTLYYGESKVITEQDYIKQKNPVRSADCIVNHDNIILMFDAKLSVPNTLLYINDQEKLNSKIRQYVECVQQMKKKIDDYGFYFNLNNFPSVSKSNIYAIIVVMQDSYILRDKIYNEYFAVEKIKEDSELALYIKSHILIMDIKDLEESLFYGQDICNCILEREHKKSFNNYNFSDFTEEGNHPLNEKVSKYVDKKCKRAISEIKKLQRDGLLPNLLKRITPT